MNSLAIFFCFTGFYHVYTASQRVKKNFSNAYLRYMHNHTVYAKCLGIFFILCSLGLLLTIQGNAQGLCIFLLLLMITGVLTVALSPLEIVCIRYIIILLLAGAIIEII